MGDRRRGEKWQTPAVAPAGGVGDAVGQIVCAVGGGDPTAGRVGGGGRREMVMAPAGKGDSDRRRAGYPGSLKGWVVGAQTCGPIDLAGAPVRPPNGSANGSADGWNY
jgi:hypothetical protein